MQRKVTQVEEDLAKLEETMGQLESEMAKPEIQADHLALTELNQQLGEAQEKQEALLEEWENASLELEEYEN